MKKFNENVNNEQSKGHYDYPLLDAIALLFYTQLLLNKFWYDAYLFSRIYLNEKL